MGLKSSPPRPNILSCVDVAHGQAHAALTVDFEHFYAHDVAFLEFVADALYAHLHPNLSISSRPARTVELVAAEVSAGDLETIGR